MIGKAKFVVTQSPDVDPVPVEIIAESIVKISKAMEAISKTRLNRRALIVLISESSGTPRTHVKNVLDSLQQLAEDYLTKVPKK
jgi:hypothetical protein